MQAHIYGQKWYNLWHSLGTINKIIRQAICYVYSRV